MNGTPHLSHSGQGFRCPTTSAMAKPLSVISRRARRRGGGSDVSELSDNIDPGRACRYDFGARSLENIFPADEVDATVVVHFKTPSGDWQYVVRNCIHDLQNIARVGSDANLIHGWGVIPQQKTR